MAVLVAAGADQLTPPDRPASTPGGPRSRRTEGPTVSQTTTDPCNPRPTTCRPTATATPTPPTRRPAATTDASSDSSETSVLPRRRDSWTFLVFGVAFVAGRSPRLVIGLWAAGRDTAAPPAPAGQTITADLTEFTITLSASDGHAEQHDHRHQRRHDRPHPRRRWAPTSITAEHPARRHRHARPVLARTGRLHAVLQHRRPRRGRHEDPAHDQRDGDRGAARRAPTAMGMTADEHAAMTTGRGAEPWTRR